MLAMNDSRIQEIITVLKTNDDNSVPFIKTKKELLGKGYSEKEIVYALYSFPYDGKPNAKAPENPVKKFFEENPEDANKTAKVLLRNLAEQDFQKIAAYGMASVVAGQINDHHAEAYYTSRYADEVGFPLFRVLLLTIVVAVLAVKFQAFWYIYTAIGVIANIWLIYLGYKKYAATRKR